MGYAAKRKKPPKPVTVPDARARRHLDELIEPLDIWTNWTTVSWLAARGLNPQPRRR